MMNEIHLDVANAVNYSLNATNAMFDMANKLIISYGKMPEGKEKNKMKKQRKAELEAT